MFIKINRENLIEYNCVLKITFLKVCNIYILLSFLCMIIWLIEINYLLYLLHSHFFLLSETPTVPVANVWVKE